MDGTHVRGCRPGLVPICRVLLYLAPIRSAEPGQLEGERVHLLVSPCLARDLCCSGRRGRVNNSLRKDRSLAKINDVV